MKRYITGFKKPSARAYNHIITEADESFMMTSPSWVLDEGPQIPGWKVGCEGLMLSGRNVEPHTDGWSGHGMYVGPQMTVFWLVRGECEFFAEGHRGQSEYQYSVSLVANQWVAFDHRKVHCVLADKKWFSLVFNIKPVRKRRQPTETL